MTVALNATKNAGILAAQIIATFDTSLGDKLEVYKDSLGKKVLDSSKTI